MFMEPCYDESARSSMCVGTLGTERLDSPYGVRRNPDSALAFRMEVAGHQNQYVALAEPGGAVERHGRKA